ncbi:hypothetical protein F5Y07DRAFT_371282 [Xylaria sp. FL0933]|nr:hypothetical protein F5Y07DRAFT_371282 [Xylaria sp. FL0933]
MQYESFAASPNTKICVSSRPLTVYMDAFDGDIDRCLKLEDLTKSDIYKITRAHTRSS